MIAIYKWFDSNHLVYAVAGTVESANGCMHKEINMNLQTDPIVKWLQFSNGSNFQTLQF